MSIIAGLDLETTGLDKETDYVTEIGAVLWHTEKNAPVKFFNKLIKIPIPVPEFIVKLTGIDDDLLEKHGELAGNVWTEFEEFIKPADYLCAHNAPFDAGFIKRILPNLDKKWIDSSVDIEYPDSIQTRKLIHLAAEHGFVNPFAHRAVTDVLTMMQLLSKYDWNKTIESANTPSVTMRAMVPFEQNQKAKTAGYRWDGNRKFWVKNVKENKVNEETIKCNAAGFLSKKIS